MSSITQRTLWQMHGTGQQKSISLSTCLKLCTINKMCKSNSLPFDEHFITKHSLPPGPFASLPMSSGPLSAHFKFVSLVSNAPPQYQLSLIMSSSYSSESPATHSCSALLLVTYNSQEDAPRIPSVHCTICAICNWLAASHYFLNFFKLPEHFTLSSLAVAEAKNILCYLSVSELW